MRVAVTNGDQRVLELLVAICVMRRRIIFQHGLAVANMGVSTCSILPSGDLEELLDV